MPAWFKHPAVLVAASVLLPPLGLVLLWLGRGRLLLKILGTVAIGWVAWQEGKWLFGWKIERYGSGMPTLSTDASRHYRRLEREREKERQAEPGKPPPAPAANVPFVPAAAAPAPGGGAAVFVWSAFRGPERDGYYPGRILTEWPKDGLVELWRTPVGGGYASMVVADGLLFTIEQRRNREVVAGYDAGTGRELWTHGYEAEFREALGGDGPRATPTWHDGVLYSLGATGELRCLEARTGLLKWKKNILSDTGATNLTWGMSASPLVVDEKLIVQPGGSGGKSIVAYHRLTGERVWGALDDRQAYTSPMLVTLAGRRQILTVTATRAVGLDPETGSLLWEYPWKTDYDVNSAQPVVTGPSRFVLSAGYGHGAALVELSGSGERLEARTVWQNLRMKNKFNSSVLHEGHLYGLDEAILACVNAETGEQKWKGGRYGYGQVLLASGHLVISTEDGDVALVQATPERHVERARFPAVPGKTWNTPAIHAGRLYVRNTTEMVCYRLDGAR